MLDTGTRRTATNLTHRKLFLAGITMPALLTFATAGSVRAALLTACSRTDPLLFVHPELRPAARQLEQITESAGNSGGHEVIAGNVRSGIGLGEVIDAR